MSSKAEQQSENTSGSSDEAFSILLERFIAHSGLHSVTQHEQQFTEAVESRMKHNGVVDVNDYQQRFEDASFMQAELDALTRELTIGETYFMRHPQVFSELHKLLDDRLAKGGNPSLRIWCAASSIGCEPYSIAIVLEELRSKYFNLDYEIFASDINPDFVKKAEEATYSAWSFRNLSNEWINHYFEPRGRDFELKPIYRSKVTFFQHNLMEGPPLSIGSPVESLDIIFCRNVLIYFNYDIIRKLAGEFESLLRPDGLLILGPSESNVQLFSQYAVLNFSDAVFYRKKTHGEVLRTRPPTPAFQTRPKTQKLKPTTPSKPKPKKAAPTQATDATAIRKLLQQQSWHKAVEVAEKALLLDDLNATLHLYCAYSNYQYGDLEQADLHYKKAIYLDRSSAAAHYLKILHHKPSTPRSALAKQVKRANEIIRQHEGPIQLPEKSISSDEALNELEALLA